MAIIMSQKRKDIFMKNSMVKIFVCVFAAYLVCIACSAFLPLKEQNIYDSVIRLHVLANSDSDSDQEVKLKVRDAVLAHTSEIFSGKTYKEALDIAKDSVPLLKETADKVLFENGFDYKSNIVIDFENYPTRNYEEASLPAGEYMSVRVELGQAEGKNWWCVLFPPMCNGVAQKIETNGCGEEETFTVSKKPRFSFKFFFLEIFG